MSLPESPHARAALAALMQQLRQSDRQLPETLKAQILAMGSASVPGLIAILEEALTNDEADHGWAPMHAATLLGMLGDAQATPVLLRMLEVYDVLDGYHLEAENALVALGNPAIEACLEAYPTATNEDLRSGIVSVLSRSAYSTRKLPPIPRESCHLFHGKTATDSTAKLPPVPRQNCH